MGRPAALGAALLVLAGCAQSRVVMVVDRPLSPERVEWLQSQLEDDAPARIHLADSEAGAWGHGLSFDPNEVHWMDEMGRLRWASFTQVEWIAFKGPSPLGRRVGMLVGGVVSFLVAFAAAVVVSADSNPSFPGSYVTSTQALLSLAVALGGGVAGGLLGGSAGGWIGRRFGPTTTVEFVPK